MRLMIAMLAIAPLLFGRCYIACAVSLHFVGVRHSRYSTPKQRLQFHRLHACTVDDIPSRQPLPLHLQVASCIFSAMPRCHNRVILASWLARVWSRWMLGLQVVFSVDFDFDGGEFCATGQWRHRPRLSAIADPVFQGGAVERMNTCRVSSRIAMSPCSASTGQAFPASEANGEIRPQGQWRESVPRESCRLPRGWRSSGSRLVRIGGKASDSTFAPAERPAPSLVLRW